MKHQALLFLHGWGGGGVRGVLVTDVGGGGRLGDGMGDDVLSGW